MPRQLLRLFRAPASSSSTSTGKRGLGLLGGMLLLGALLAWLLWPLASPRFRITTDTNKLAAKQAFLLEQARPRTRTPTGTPARPPNIVVILADDLGKTDLPLYGRPRGSLRTPHIDSIAQ